MSKNVIIKGTLILTIAGVLTKLLGFYNRIFLTRVIGVKELGIYQLIFPIYLLAIAFCCQGISTAVTKHVSYHLGKRDNANAKAVFKYGLVISLILSLVSMLIIYLLSDCISLYLLKNSECGRLLRIVAVALPIVAVKNCINAYYIGDGRPEVQGASHFTEQLVRIITAYVLTYILCTTPRNATLATISVVSGEVFSGVLSIVIILIANRNSHKSSSFTKHNRDSFLQDALPITTNNLIFTLFASLEAIILPAMLYRYYQDSSTSMELYGIVTGIVIPFLLFPATITTSMSTMLLPAITGAKANDNNHKIKTAIITCGGFSVFLGIIAWLGYSLLGEWACEVAFKSREAGTILQAMSFLCPFIYVSGIFSTILNGLDKAFNNLMINVSGLIIRICFTHMLVPQYGLKAYICGMFVSYLFMIIIMSVTIRKALRLTNLKA